MERKITVLTLCLMLFALSLSAHAQQPKQISKIGYLTATSLSAIAARTEAFRQGLRELGYIEGKTLSWSNATQMED